MLVQAPIAEAIECGPEADPATMQTVPVWRPAALHAVSLVAEVARDSHADVLARCTPWAPRIKAAIQATLDNPFVQQPGERAAAGACSSPAREPSPFCISLVRCCAEAKREAATAHTHCTQYEHTCARHQQHLLVGVGQRLALAKCIGGSV